MTRPAEGPTAVVGVGRKRAALRVAMAEGGFPPRATLLSWPATRLGSDEVIDLVNSVPFVAGRVDTRKRRAVGVELLFDWLGDMPG